MSDEDGARGVDRRRVLRWLVGGSGLAAAGMIGVPVGRYLVPPEHLARDAVASLRAGEIGLWEARQVVVAGRPVLVLNTGDGHRAFSAVCTHLGCVVKWSKARRQFLCPCHGARFDADGVVRGGPAPRPLARLEVTETPGAIEIRRIAARKAFAEVGKLETAGLDAEALETAGLDAEKS